MYDPDNTLYARGRIHDIGEMLVHGETLNDGELCIAIEECFVEDEDQERFDNPFFLRQEVERGSFAKWPAQFVKHRIGSQFFGR